MKKSSVLIGKTIRAMARLRGGGSALPGLIVEKLDPGFLKQTLGKLPRGVIVISGTNGKTTTTKILTELLESHGLKVFTNRTGSNFIRGIISELIGAIHGGKLDADIAVLELDEAHAVHFVKEIKPNYTLLLNVLRDQLDRFGEISKTAKLLEQVAQATTDGVLLNRNDSLISDIAKRVSVPIKYFGYSPKLSAKFPDDTHLHNTSEIEKSSEPADVELVSFKDDKAEYKMDKKVYDAKLQLSGAHNILNAAAALAMARMVLAKDTDNNKLLTALSQVKPAFGRGETINLKNQNLDLILVKNPSGFRLALASQYNPEADIMIAINDQHADGRDVSWLYDVNFTTLKNVTIVSGIRAYDMALRLQYDNIQFDKVEPDLKKALAAFLKRGANRPKQIYCSYTAMLRLRKMLSRVAKFEDNL